MTLKELIELYRTEQYKFWKQKNSDGYDITRHFVFETHAEYLDEYLGFYKNLPNLTEVIVLATDGIFKLTDNGIEYFIRHNHQETFVDKQNNSRGVPYDVSREVRNNIIKRINELSADSSFDKVFAIVEQCKVKGFGELAIYDTTVRISSFLRLEPDKVYLHAGTRAGVKVLEERGYIKFGNSNKKFIEIVDIPEPIQQLRPLEIEHMLCSMKEKMETLLIHA